MPPGDDDEIGASDGIDAERDAEVNAVGRRDPTRAGSADAQGEPGRRAVAAGPSGEHLQRAAEVEGDDTVQRQGAHTKHHHSLARNL